jgi:transposase
LRETAAAQLAAAQARLAVLAAQVEELRRSLGKDSSTSSRPPSSDNPYQKKPRDRSLRHRSGRKPGKEPGAQSSTLQQSGHPDDTVKCVPQACGCCGADLAGEPVAGVVKQQVSGAQPPPPPKVIEYQVQAKKCPACGEMATGPAPAGVTGRVQYGPLVHARAALATCAHYLPVARVARLICDLTGVRVSVGFTSRRAGQGRGPAGPVHGTHPAAAGGGRGAVRRRDPGPRTSPASSPGTGCGWPAGSATTRT